MTLLAVPNPPQEPLAARVRRLQAEAQRLAAQHTEELRAGLENVARIAAEIAAGGEAYSVGARDMARRLAEDASAKAMTLGAILERMK